jgi:hypothetical protein
MLPISPSQSIMNTPRGVLRWAQSIYKAITGGIELAQGIGQNSNGVYNKFAPDNHNGTMIRIGAYNDSTEPIKWSSSGVGIPIYHGLGKLPLGFHITDLEGDSNVYRTIPATNQVITLAPTDASVAATVFIF